MSALTMTPLGLPLGTLPLSAVTRRGRVQTIDVTRGQGIGTVTRQTDEALLGAYREGDRGALREIIDRYHDELLQFLTRFVGSRAAAEDVFQETFLQIHLSAGTFDVTRRFKPWLFTIAANKGRDYHRKHTRRQALSLQANVGGDSDGRQFIDLMEADLPIPEQATFDNEQASCVREAVDSLPSHLREILLLSYFQRMSYGQIAESLEIPLGTVKSRLHTAVATFARAWQAKLGLDEGDEDGSGDESEGIGS